LSADAVPAWLEAFPRLDPNAQPVVARELLERWASADGDWRRWSLSRDRAHRLVADSEPMLREHLAPAQASAR
jgi:hypothetical protein